MPAWDEASTGRGEAQRRPTWPVSRRSACGDVSRLLEAPAAGGVARPATAAPGDGSVSSGEELAPRPLTAEERERAWTAANFFGARPQQSEPLALWILGPSSVGKSTLTAMVAPRFGIGLAQGAQEPPEASRQHLDAVIVDGEFMRDAHGVYCRWIKTDGWKSAYPALKSVINQEKDSMCTAAAEDRRHLVIPQTMLNLDKGLTEVVQLSCQGYTNHVVAVVAPLEDCQRRGAARELETGKRYEPREFRKSIDSIWPMISACNGRYELLHAVEPEAKVRRLEYRTLASGLCRKSPIYEGAYPSVDEDSFRGLLRSALGSSGEDDAVVSSASSGALDRQTSIPGLPCGDPSLAPRPLTEEERSRAWRSANFDATPSHQERPVAVWVLGPARVGKSALIAQLGGSFDVLEPAEGAGCRVDGVLVDGNIFREAHSVYQQWAEAASPAAAASAFKSTSDREKDLLVTKAALCHKNIVMGRRLTDLNKGLTEIEGLKWQGYTNHVVAVVATFEECQRRAGPEGARCTRRDYDASLRAIPPMIAACNGRYAILRPAERPEPSDAPILFSCRCQGQGVPEGGSATSLAFSSLESLTREVEQALAQDGD